MNRAGRKRKGETIRIAYVSAYIGYLVLFVRVLGFPAFADSHRIERPYLSISSHLILKPPPSLLPQPPSSSLSQPSRQHRARRRPTASSTGNSPRLPQSCPSFPHSPPSLSQRSAKRASTSPHPLPRPQTLPRLLRAPSTSFFPTPPTTPPRRQAKAPPTRPTDPIPPHQTLLTPPSPFPTLSRARALSTSQTSSPCPS